MNIATQSSQADSEAAEQIRASLEGKQVCPFCGSINVDAGACPRCGMDNTPAARRATRSRIGPWYVLQQRNPAAPGMRFDTLLMFARKQRVRSRSIVRGPTTHQLWRFAAQVKGLSREFGLCYSCGQEIDRTCDVCPQCNRSQLPVGNADALLEGAEPESAIKHAAEQRPSDAPSRVNGRMSLEPLPPTADEPVAAYETAPAAPDSGSPSERPRGKAGENFLSARELAAAFQLDFDPKASFDGADPMSDDEQDAPPAPSPKRAAPRRNARRRHPVLKTMTAIVLLAGGSAAAAICFSPQVRTQALRYYTVAQAKVSDMIERSRAKTDGNRAIKHPAPIQQLSVGDVPANQPPAAHPATERSSDSNGLAALLNQSRIATATQPRPAQPLHPPAPTPRVSEPPAIKPHRLAPPTAAELADPGPHVRTLYYHGIDAEGNGDFATAVADYEQIKKYPRGQWPTDIEVRLKFASAHLPNR